LEDGKILELAYNAGLAYMVADKDGNTEPQVENLEGFRYFVDLIMGEIDGSLQNFG
jgi:hypothetical protein